MRKDIKIIVEKHPDGYVAYQLGLKGVVVGEGDSYEATLEDAKSAIDFHVESFGADVFDDQSVLEAFVAEADCDWQGTGCHLRRLPPRADRAVKTLPSRRW